MSEDQRSTKAPQLIFTALLMLSYSLCASSTSEREVRAAFDFSKAHRFGGFGVQIWSPSEHPEALASLLRDSKFQFVRMSLPRALESAHLMGGMSPIEIAGVMTRSSGARNAERL